MNQQMEDPCLSFSLCKFSLKEEKVFKNSLKNYSVRKKAKQFCPTVSTLIVKNVSFSAEKSILHFLFLKVCFISKADKLYLLCYTPQIIAIPKTGPCRSQELGTLLWVSDVVAGYLILSPQLFPPKNMNRKWSKAQS